jgi:hypothetical protein
LSRRAPSYLVEEAFEKDHVALLMRESFGQNLDGYIAPELGVVRLEHFAHSARADGCDDFVGT